MPIHVEELLQPIPGDNPSGRDLRYEPVYDEIKEARREDDAAPQGAWERERKVADWKTVIKLCTEALSKQTKDLQLAAWLTEALLKTEGFAGLRSGLQLTQGLLENFWDTIYPEIEDGDAEMRSAPLAWLGLKLDVAVKSVALVRSGHSFLLYHEAQNVVGYEASVSGDYNKTQARNKLIEQGKLSGEEWDKAFDETPKAFYKQLVADLGGSLKLVTTIDQIGDKFGDVAPGYSVLKKALEEVQQLSQTLLKNKLAVDPDPIEETPVVEEGAAASADSGAPADGPLAAEPVNREDAVNRVISAARFLRKTEPGNPAAYLMLRGLRWGELRASSGKIEPRLLVAPTTALRSQLKSLLLDGKWPGLLEACETAMGQPCGRGWLDLQRYAVEACSHLGRDYHAVDAALRAALRAFLSDVPEITSATMMDDTPAANLETLQWIAAEIQQDGEGAGRPQRRAAAPGSDGFRSEAMDLARAGRAEEAVEMLTRQVEQERSLRGRFRLRTQLAAILVEAGRDIIAQPILEELLAQIDNFRLEDWENGQIVAEPMALLYRVQTKLEYDFSMRQPLYLRICRLDPTQALRCPQ